MKLSSGAVNAIVVSVFVCSILVTGLIIVCSIWFVGWWSILVVPACAYLTGLALIEVAQWGLRRLRLLDGDEV